MDWDLGTGWFISLHWTLWDWIGLLLSSLIPSWTVLLDACLPTCACSSYYPSRLLYSVCVFLLPSSCPSCPFLHSGRPSSVAFYDALLVGRDRVRLTLQCLFALLYFQDLDLFPSVPPPFPSTPHTSFPTSLPTPCIPSSCATLPHHFILQHIAMGSSSSAYPICLVLHSCCMPHPPTTDPMPAVPAVRAFTLPWPQILQCSSFASAGLTLPFPLPGIPAVYYLYTPFLPFPNPTSCLGDSAYASPPYHCRTGIVCISPHTASILQFLHWVPHRRSSVTWQHSV